VASLRRLRLALTSGSLSCPFCRLKLSVFFPLRNPRGPLEAFLRRSVGLSPRGYNVCRAGSCVVLVWCVSSFSLFSLFFLFLGVFLVIVFPSYIVSFLFISSNEMPEKET